MKKILAIVIGIAFAFGSAGYVAAQTPAPKADEKKADDKASEKMEKKKGASKKATKKGESMDKKMDEPAKKATDEKKAAAPAEKK